MPLIRKIIPFGKTSRAVILPKSWLEYFEQETGESVGYVAMEVDRALTITPVIQKSTQTSKREEVND